MNTCLLAFYIVAILYKSGFGSAICQGGTVYLEQCARPTWGLIVRDCTARNEVREVCFFSPFDTVPAFVLVGLNTLDFSYKRGIRLALTAEHITPQGFNLRIGTWADTILYAARASWIACL